jgi:hypothetical protein
MDTRRAIAVGLAFASFLLAVAFAIVMGACGAMQASPGDPGSCVPVFHPLAPVWAAFALIGMASLWWWRAWPAITLGAIGLALGVISGFSAGFYGIGCGALLLAAGVVGAKAGGGRNQRDLAGDGPPAGENRG